MQLRVHFTTKLLSRLCINSSLSGSDNDFPIPRQRESVFFLCFPLSLFAFVVCFFAGVLFGIWIWIFSVAWIGYYWIAVHRGWCARLCGWRNAFECDFGVYTYLQRLVSICRHSFSFSHSLCQRSPRPLYSGRWAPHTYAFTRKIVYIRVPSDLTEATRVSIHTQSARPSCWVNANELIENHRCLSSSSSSSSVGVCSSLCPSWATMLARRLPFFLLFSTTKHAHTHHFLGSGFVDCSAAVQAWQRFGLVPSLVYAPVYECKFDIFLSSEKSF